MRFSIRLPNNAFGHAIYDGIKSSVGGEYRLTKRGRILDRDKYDADFPDDSGKARRRFKWGLPLKYSKEFSVYFSAKWNVK